jgi:hypothetical protein
MNCMNVRQPQRINAQRKEMVSLTVGTEMLPEGSTNKWMLDSLDQVQFRPGIAMEVTSFRPDTKSEISVADGWV